ncbi:hypothetical protein OG21DRAFT_588781 [Imleria badia]|nr:hypothetical protein OG21DRAFT_588781 [Imleria badia]
MTWTRGERSSASMTLKALLLLLVSCPKLRVIGLTLDARDVPVAGTHTDVCNSSDTFPMEFHNCPLKDPELVAEFLMKHLPSMPRVDCTHTLHMHPTVDSSSDLEYQRLWTQVNQRMCPSFRPPEYVYVCRLPGNLGQRILEDFYRLIEPTLFPVIAAARCLSFTCPMTDGTLRGSARTEQRTKARCLLRAAMTRGGGLFQCTRISALYHGDCVFRTPLVVVVTPGFIRLCGCSGSPLMQE